MPQSVPGSYRILYRKLQFSPIVFPGGPAHAGVNRWRTLLRIHLWHRRDRTREYRSIVTGVSERNKDSIFKRRRRMPNILNVLAERYGTHAQFAGIHEDRPHHGADS